jgi:hypothetical protein
MTIYRQGRTLYYPLPEGGFQSTTFASVNAAKRESRNSHHKPAQAARRQSDVRRGFPRQRR